MPMPRRYPDRTMTSTERARLTRERQADQLARATAALAWIVVHATEPAIKVRAAEALTDEVSAP